MQPATEKRQMGCRRRMPEGHNTAVIKHFLIANQYHGDKQPITLLRKLWVGYLTTI